MNNKHYVVYYIGGVGANGYKIAPKICFFAQAFFGIMSG